MTHRRRKRRSNSVTKLHTVQTELNKLRRGIRNLKDNMAAMCTLSKDLKQLIQTAKENEMKRRSKEETKKDRG